jgi:protein tyrosine/serine phosphatase
LEGGFNVRDIGGYPTRDGHTVRWQRVYRAGGPHALTADDVTALRALEIATVLDLRTLDETNEHATYRDTLAPQAHHHLPMIETLPDEASHAKWVDPDVVAAHYFDMLESGSDAVAKALSIMSDPSAYPVLIHCSAGKDRTGVLVAVLLELLGVDDQAVIDDYALSGDAMGSMLEYFKSRSPEARERLEAAPAAMFAAEPAAMAGFLARVRAAHGDFAGLAAALGVERAIPRLQAALLETQARNL